MHFKCPLPAAQWRGVVPKALLQLLASALASSSARTHFAWPVVLAQWSGRKPSCARGAVERWMSR